MATTTREELVLGEARRLAEEGRAREAVEFVTNAVRQERSHVLEIELLNLRHEAYLQLDGSPPSAPWPPDSPSIDISGDGVPEADPDDLSSDLVAAALDRRGCLMVRQLVPVDAAARLAKDIQLTMDRAHAVLDGSERHGQTAFFAGFTRDGRVVNRMLWRGTIAQNQVALADTPRTMFDLTEALREAGVLELAAEYLGEPPVFLASKGAVRRNEPGMRKGWHQDASYYGLGVRALGLWLAAAPCGPGVAPGLEIIPGHFDALIAGLPIAIGKGLDQGLTSSHVDDSATDVDPVRYFRPEKPPGLLALADRTIDALAEETPIQRPHFAAGDAVFFNALVPHQGASGEDFETHRLIIEMWFFGASCARMDSVPLLIGL